MHPPHQHIVMNLVYCEFLGHSYDFLHPFMTATQRVSVRGALALATRGHMWVIGMDGLRPSGGVTSNWLPMHICQLMVNALAIEGEEGYNPDLFWRVHQGEEEGSVGGEEE